MLVERPFPKEYAFAQQGSCPINQHVFGLQPVMMKQNQFPTRNVQGYRGLSAEKAWQRTLGCNTRMGAFSSWPICSTKASFASGYSTNSGFGKPKRVLGSNNPEMQQEIFAFGPKHAEHARRLNQSKGGNQQYQQILALPCRSDYGPMQNLYEQTQGRGFFSREPVSCVKKQPVQYPYISDGPLQLTVESEPLEIVLKVANISSRPDKKQFHKPKAVFGFLENGHNEKVEHVRAKKSIDFLDNEDEIDLSNAPIFQILCEISKMY
jgi:hypothetical protein